jgi:hypothetical protein
LLQPVVILPQLLDPGRGEGAGGTSLNTVPVAGGGV